MPGSLLSAPGRRYSSRLDLKQAGVRPNSAGRRLTLLGIRLLQTKFLSVTADPSLRHMPCAQPLLLLQRDWPKALCAAGQEGTRAQHVWRLRHLLSKSVK